MKIIRIAERSWVAGGAAASMLTAEHMLRTGTVYEDLTERYFDTRDRLKLVHRLGDLGVQVELKGAA